MKGGGDPHTASQFPVLCIQDWMRESSFSGSAPTTPDSGGQESMRPSDQSYINPFSFIREFCLGSGEYPACSCVFLSLSEGRRGLPQNSSTKTSVQIPNCTSPMPRHSTPPQKPSLDIYSSCPPFLVREVARLSSSVNCMIQVDSQNPSDGVSVTKAAG